MLERSTVQSRLGVGVLEGRSPRTRHQMSRAERLVLAPVKIDLPATQSAARVDNSPARASEYLLHGPIRSYEFHTVSQAGLSPARSGGISRNEPARPTSNRIMRKAE